MLNKVIDHHKHPVTFWFHMLGFIVLIFGLWTHKFGLIILAILFCILGHLFYCNKKELKTSKKPLKKKK